MTAGNAEFIAKLQAISGTSHVLTDEQRTRRFATGFRFGYGRVLTVVQPGSLLEQWSVLKACVEAGKIVIMQAANTGLTGGSTPDGGGYDREIVIINTLRLNTIRVIREGKQVICHPGATLDGLERKLKPLRREPHSVIGSSCIGASVAGGICNNSGGALVRRGPAYTELALYAQLHDDGRLELVNHLGVKLSGTPEEILLRIDLGDFSEADIQDGGRASDNEYGKHVRDIDAASPARFNADPRRLFEASGCAGKLALFAVRLDTFPAERTPTVFYIGTNDKTALAEMRRHILGKFKFLPVAGEYIHKDAFDIAEKYGKDTFLIIRHLGTRFLAPLFAFKGRFDTWFKKPNTSDRILQWLASLFPSHLPKRMKDYRKKYDHHLILQVTNKATDEARAYLKELFANETRGAFFECTAKEARRALLHRFAVAGAGIRYRNMNREKFGDIVAFDIALRRNDPDWFEELPPEITKNTVAVLYCGHFLCHVFHQDYILRKGVDSAEFKRKMLEIISARGAEYPAEHNVGHFYKAKPVLSDFYRKLDPLNALNPGIGMTSKKRGWKD